MEDFKTLNIFKQNDLWYCDNINQQALIIHFNPSKQNFLTEQERAIAEVVANAHGYALVRISKQDNVTPQFLQGCICPSCHRYFRAALPITHCPCCDCQYTL